MTFFFGIARRLPNPPWPVTANVCVPGRSNNVVWFSGQYPKTGGGEDVRMETNASHVLQQHWLVTSVI